MASYPTQTTGLGTPTQVVVPGNVSPISSVPGKNNLQLSLTSINGYPATFQLAPLLEDVADNVIGESTVATQLGVAADYALLGYSGITNTGSTSIAGGSIGAGTGSTAITGFNPPTAVVDQADVAAAQVALAAAIVHYQGLAAGSYTITAAATTVGSTAVYTGTFANGAANGLVGTTFLVAGFATNASNNGTFLVTASTATTVTLNNGSAIAETHAATATQKALANLSTGGNGATAATYLPGNYFSVAASSLDIPTTITLDAQGNPNATFVFVAGSTITLESGASVLLVNGAQAANVVFVAGSSFTSVATSTMNGTVLAAVSATLGGGVLNGRALANTGAVTIAAAEAITVPLSFGSVPITYVVYGSRNVAAGFPNGEVIATVSAGGLVTAVATGGATVEASYPAFGNAIGDIVSAGNIMNGLPVNKIYSELNLQVGV